MRTPQADENSELKPPRLPDVTRLNRNVLLVAGMGVAVVVLAVTHVVRSDTRNVASRAGTAQVEAGTVADFLRAPLGPEADAPVPPPVDPDLAAGTNTGLAPPAATRQRAPTYEMQPPSAAYGAFHTPDPREEAYERALRAGLRPREAGPNVFTTAGGSIAAVPGRERSGTDMGARSAADRLASPVDASAGAAPMIIGSQETFADNAAAHTLDDRSHEFAEAMTTDVEPTSYIRSRITEPVSEYQIMAGTVLPAMLVTAMNSDMPGEILAQISRNVYDSHQRHLLIPRGAKVIGRYDNQVALGQSRVLIAWTRLIFPDGRSLSLPGLPTKDLRGASGVHSDVNNHYARLYGQAALLSIIGAGAQLSQPQQSNILAAASPGQIAAGALGQQLSQVSMESIRRNMDVRPTLEVKAGTPFYIFLERDLVLDGTYIDRRTSNVPSNTAGEALDAPRF
ncbi:MAG: TrbI/VirB10 family protein [Longimicrobiales bacterium]